MRVAVLTAPGEVRVEDRPEPTILTPTDAVIRLSATCICGSDLWPYRGVEALDGPRPMGHEYVGIVEEVGSQVTTIRRGQLVVGSFFASDNTCEPAGRLGRPRNGLVRGGRRQGRPGRDGRGRRDGAVGLLGVLAAKELGAGRIIAMSRHAARQRLAVEFGATDIMEERGPAGVARIRDLTGGPGAHSVIEAVGTQEFDAAGHPGHPPGRSSGPCRRQPQCGPGREGAAGPAESTPAGSSTLELPLDEAAAGYRAMDRRDAVKVLPCP